MPDPIAFLSYAVLTIFTPGPNNIMALSTATRHGFRGSARFRLGAAAGFFGVMTVAFVFTIALYRAIPTIKPWMAGIGAAYVLWLAYTTVFGGSHGGGRDPQNTALAGAALQFVNPKVILFGVSATATFIVPYYHAPLVFAGFAGVLALMALTAMTCWAAFGTVFERFMRDHERVVSWIMGALLVYSAVSIVSEVLPR